MIVYLDKLEPAERAAATLVNALEAGHPAIAVARQIVSGLTLDLQTAEAESRTAAASSESEKRLTLTAAKERLAAAEQPLQHMLKIPKELTLISPRYNDGAIARRVKNVLDKVSAEYMERSLANSRVKAARAAVDEAEARVTEATSKLRKLEQTTRLLRQAQKHPPEEASAKALSLKEEELDQAKTVHSQAQIDLENATTELSEAVKAAPVIFAAFELLMKLEALWTEANKSDQAFAQNAREQARREAEQAARRADPCTCSETSGTCSHCFLKQRSSQFGWDREPDPTR